MGVFETVTDQKPVVYLNSVQVYIQLSVSVDNPEEIFITSASLIINLGDLFNHFINQKFRSKKVSIDISDNEQQPYIWKFYTRLLLGNKELNPHISLQQNKIKERSIIIARRII